MFRLIQGSDEELSGDDDDPDLLNELSEITGNEPDADANPTSPPTESMPEVTPTTDQPILSTTTMDTVELLKGRIEMYKMAEKIAKESGDNIRARSRGRGIVAAPSELPMDMLKQVGKTNIDGEKPALKQQIQAEFDKNADQKPPKPTRGANKSSSSSCSSVVDEENDEDEQPEIKLSDMLPRADISSQITEALLAEISDKNWKTRNLKGLIKLQRILNEARLIKPTIGDLPQVLAHRLVDSNAKIAQTSMAICQQLAEAMGPSCKQHVRVLFPGFLNGLGDSKAVMRAAAITCMNTWGDQCGFKQRPLLAKNISLNKNIAYFQPLFVLRTASGKQ